MNTKDLNAINNYIQRQYDAQDPAQIISQQALPTPGENEYRVRVTNNDGTFDLMIWTENGHVTDEDFCN